MVFLEDLMGNQIEDELDQLARGWELRQEDGLDLLNPVIKSQGPKPGVVVHTCSHITLDTEAEDRLSLGVADQPGPYSETSMKCGKS